MVLFLTRKGHGMFLIIFTNVGILRIMDNQRSTETIGVLGTDVRVPPVGTRLVDEELIGEALAGGDRALPDVSSAIHVRSPFVIETVPVDAGGFIAEVVSNVDDDLVAEVHFEGRTRPLSVDAYTIRKCVSSQGRKTPRTATKEKGASYQLQDEQSRQGRR